MILKILDKIADDIIQVVDDPHEIAVELKCDFNCADTLRGNLVHYINDLGPNLPSWIADWQGRTVRKIFRILELPQPPYTTSPEEMVKQWLRYRGVKIPEPKNRPRQLYREMMELLTQFKKKEGSIVLLQIIFPMVEKLILFILIYYLQCYKNEEIDVTLHGEPFQIWDEKDNEIRLPYLMKNLKSCDLRGLASILTSIKQVSIPSYSTYKTKTFSLIISEEIRLLENITNFCDNFKIEDSGDSEAMELITYLTTFFQEWEERFKLNAIPIPYGAIVYTVTQEMFTRKVKCITENDLSFIITGVTNQIDTNSEILIHPDSKPKTSVNEETKIRKKVRNARR